MDSILVNGFVAIVCLPSAGDESGDAVLRREGKICIVYTVRKGCNPYNSRTMYIFASVVVEWTSRCSFIVPSVSN